MLGTAFQDVAQMLSDIKESNDSWHLTLLRDHSKTSKLLLFTGADFATMEASCLHTISQTLETHLSAGIGKTPSINLIHSSPLPLPSAKDVKKMQGKAF
jgi:hypothetical protein